ncbi:DNA-binding transcriptional regulator, AcrR family [Raineyella antarctica]|uniref:DNA-binding transcriptional regulator, AcrR family n=1 Tax=Raineyella antarctica TaxID=1577474 RepID=A0A1G6GFA0_9ACTN|nr:TetR/AcrR family transcriptional regulator [Raineyella antarctica]SDB80579.1 DNA-binding transcriptional regulator, AcrR family [Raineyella antarctica]
MPRKPADAATTRQRILDAARLIARDRGYKGTTLAMIQKEAGVHPGSFYWHFEDKDSLFAALVRYAYEQSGDLLERLDPRDAPNPVKVVLDSIVQNPARYGLWRFNVQLMLDPDMRDSKTAKEIRALRVATQAALTRAWLEHVPARVLAETPDLPVRMADYSLAIVEGCILSRVGGTVRDEEFITGLATVMMDRMVAVACEQVGEPVPGFFRERESGMAQLVTGHPSPVVAERVDPAASGA